MKDRNSYYLLMNELVEDFIHDTLTMSDAEILAETAKTEGDPEAIAAEMRARLNQMFAQFDRHETSVNKKPSQISARHRKVDWWLAFLGLNHRATQFAFGTALSVILGIGIGWFSAKGIRTTDSWPPRTTEAFLPAMGASQTSGLFMTAAPVDLAPPGTEQIMVAVSTDLTMASAQESYKKIHDEFAKIFGQRQAVIRAVNLGQSKFFFRTEVGPFNTAGEAVEFCKNIQRRGGSCIAIAENQPLDPSLVSPLPERQRKGPALNNLGVPQTK